MKIISLNVNGVRAAYRKGLGDFIDEHTPDILGLNEVKGQEKDIPMALTGVGYEIYWNNSDKKGYAGTGVMIKSDFEQPSEIIIGVGDPNDLNDKEGRAITLRFKDFYLVNLYVPNSGMQDLKYKERRMNWNKFFHVFVDKLQRKKPVIMMGDFNVALYDDDVYDGKTNKQRSKTAGFTPYERFDFKYLLEEHQLIDTWKILHPSKPAPTGYTFWSWRGKDMKKNKRGWRIDYFLLSEDFKKNIKSMDVLQKYEMSDHCPIILEISLKR